MVAAIEANPEASEQVRAGNPKAIGPIVGAVMREAKGRADGGEVTRLIHEKLGAAAIAIGSAGMGVAPPATKRRDSATRQALSIR